MYKPEYISSKKCTYAVFETCIILTVLKSYNFLVLEIWNGKLPQILFPKGLSLLFTLLEIVFACFKHKSKLTCALLLMEIMVILKPLISFFFFFILMCPISDASVQKCKAELFFTDGLETLNLHYSDRTFR